MKAEAPLTPAELAFRALIAGVEQNGRVIVHPRYAWDCAEARARWEAEHPEHCARVMDKRFR